MKRYWLFFSQWVTVLLAAWFVVATLKPEWIRSAQRSADGMTLLQAPAGSLLNRPAGSLSGPALIIASESPIKQLSATWQSTLSKAGITYKIHRFVGESSTANINAAANPRPSATPPAASNKVSGE